MNKTLALIDAVEQRLALLVAVGIAAYTAADPSALPPKYAAFGAAAAAIAAKLTPRTAVAVAPVASAPVADVSPAEAWTNGAAQDPALAAVDAPQA